MTSLQPLFERNQEATIYIGNIDLKVTEEILWELFTQCGPVTNVHIPRDKITGDHQGYGFVEMRSEEDADYAIKIMHMIKLYGKPLKVNKASQDKRTQEVGANIFIGNLDPEVDEKMLYDTFSAFGMVVSTKITRDPETGASKGYGFVSYDSFEASDAAIANMNGQYFCNRNIHVSYAYKKDTKGERHGSAAERLLAANRPNNMKGGFFDTALTMTPNLMTPPINMPTPPTNMPVFQPQNVPPMNFPMQMPPINPPMMNQSMPMNMPPLPTFNLPTQLPNLPNLPMPNMNNNVSK